MRWRALSLGYAGPSWRLRARSGVELPDEGEVRVTFDDSIITDTSAEKRQDMAEVGVTMNAWEYRQKWYGEDEKTAKARARGLARGKASNGEDT